MARLTALPSGQLWQLFATFQDLLNRTPDPVATHLLDFDESTNSDLIADIQANWSSYTLPVVSGSPQLQKNGKAVVIAAPTSLYPMQLTILNGVSDSTLKASIVALWNGTATAQQQQRALAFALLKLKQAGLI